MDDIKPVALLPCCGYADSSAVKWNEFNGVVQCHNCGQVYTPTPTESALLQAKEEGRREGMREAAEICKKEGWKLGIPLHHSEPLIEAITRAAEGK